jgi:sugar transferase (PEP-CTERM/EpsH1 system associated)
MNILFLCHRIPYPPNKGDKIRSFNEIKYLSKKHHTSLVFLIDNKNDRKYIDELKKYCKTIDYDEIHPTWQKIKSLPYILCKQPISIPYFYSKKLQNKFDNRLSTVDFDVIFVFSSPMAEYVFNSGVNIPRKTKLIMDFVDVDSDKWRMYSEHSAFPKSFIYRNEWQCLMDYEKKIGKYFDMSIFVTDREAELFKSFAADVNAVSVPNGVDYSYFSSVRPEWRPRKARYIILFTGAMDYFPNEDGVLYFYRNIWPLIRSRTPQSEFYIVGTNPSKKVKRISGADKNVIVTGQVSDIRQYMCKADVFVAPLRIARGVQNKVLEALASGLPVVATPQAVKGLGCNGNGYLFIEDTDSAFAERTVQFVQTRLDDEAVQRRELFLKERHNWELNMALLEKVIAGNTER